MNRETRLVEGGFGLGGIFAGGEIIAQNQNTATRVVGVLLTAASAFVTFEAAADYPVARRVIGKLLRNKAERRMREGDK
jgi:hypothetical protein